MKMNQFMKNAYRIEVQIPIKFECLECGNKFKKKISSKTVDVKCPKCGGYDVEVDE